MMKVLMITALLMMSMLMAQTLSLEEARRIALENNHEYQAKAAEYQSAKWSKNAALGSVLPSLSLSGTYIYNDPATTVSAGGSSFTLNNDMRTISLNLSQPLFLGGKLWQAYKIGQISEAMAANALKNQELTLYREVETKFLSLQMMQTLSSLSAMELSSARTNLELAELKHSNGLISSAELYRFRANAATKEVSVLQTNTALQLARRDMMNYLNLDSLPQLEETDQEASDALLELLTSFDLKQTEAMIERAVRMAEKGNLNLGILESSVDLSRRAYSISKSAFLPTLMLTASRQYRENGIDRYEFNSSDQIMLNLSIPLLPQYTNYASTRTAFYNYRVTELRAKTASDGIKMGVESAVLNLIGSAKQVQASALALEYTRQSYEQMQERFRQNMLSSSDMIDIELMLSAARTASVNAFFSYLQSKTTLLNLMGSVDEQLLINISQLSMEE